MMPLGGGFFVVLFGLLSHPDNYLLWLCAVDCVEEKGFKKDNEDGVKMYEEYEKDRKIFIYNTVRAEEQQL